MVGEIYLAKIYFTDLSDYKIRPEVVVKTIDEDCICLQLTSQLNNRGISLNNSDLVDGKIKKESMIVVPKNFTLHKSILFKYIAKVNNDFCEKTFQILCQQMGCKDVQ